MYLSKIKLAKLCKKNGLLLKDLLAKAGVSKTAFYNLLYKETLLPKSIHSLASILDVKPSDLIEETPLEELNALNIAKSTNEIILRYPELDIDTIRHTILLLQEKPIERLRRGLLRGRKFNIYR